jgi:hypothetical protein
VVKARVTPPFDVFTTQIIEDCVYTVCARLSSLQPVLLEGAAHRRRRDVSKRDEVWHSEHVMCFKDQIPVSDIQM